MEGNITMSRKEQKQLEIYAMVREGVLTLVEAAERLDIGYRQVRRNYRKYQTNGASGLVHGLRGRPSNHQVDRSHRQAVILFYQERLKGFNLKHASEKLTENGLEVNSETLRLWLISEGQWTPRKRKKRQHHRQWRQRKERTGDMIQMDGSFHHWFGDDREDCLMVMVDDADNATHARLFHEETTKGAMETLKDWIEHYGIPSSLYTDRKNVYHTDREPSIEEQLKGIEPRTVFGKACEKLGITLIRAYSPQAKGRVERQNSTLQDRLVSEIRYRKLTSVEEVNGFLTRIFLPQFNRQFKKEPSDLRDAHRPADGRDLGAIFSIEEKRRVNNDWTIRHHKIIYQLKGGTSYPPAKSYVTVQERLDGTLHIYYRGKEVSYTLILDSRLLITRRAVQPLSLYIIVFASQEARQHVISGRDVQSTR